MAGKFAGKNVRSGVNGLTTELEPFDLKVAIYDFLGILTQLKDYKRRNKNVNIRTTLAKNYKRAKVLIS